MIEQWKQELQQIEKEMNELQVQLLANHPLYRELNGKRMQLKKMIEEVEMNES